MDHSNAQPKNRGPKACTTCAKAKARCIAGPEGSLKCDRCHRLDKICVSQTPAPPRARKSLKLSKIAALEKRLEELSSQVQDGSSQSASPPAAHQDAKTESGCKSPPNKWDFSHIFIKNGPPAAAPETSAAAAVAVEMPAPVPQPWDSWWPNPHEAEVLLETYQCVYAPLFPFAVVPEGMSCLELRDRRPFLWKAVMMIGCFLDGPRQMKLGKELLAQIGQAAVCDGAKSLDLLQGLQMLVAMFHYALKGSQVTNLLFLARAMCVNLPLKDDPTLEGEERDANLESMRAYAGTYYLNTLVFTANKRPDVLMNTGLLETCCRVLGSTMQCPSDEYLVQLVRVQQLAQSISLTMDIGNVAQQSMKLPLTMVVRSFQDQLDQLTNSLPPHLASNDALKSHINIAQVLLYEIGLSDQHSNVSYVPLTERLQLLWGCVRSLRSFYDIRFARRDLDRPRFLCLSSSDFVYALITGLKLLTLQLPGWNVLQIQQELNMVEVMDSQIRDLVILVARRKSGLAAAAVPQQQQQPEEPFERLLRQLKTLRDMVKLELERQTAGFSALSGMDMGQDLMVQDLENDFWQSMGAVDVWNVVGDPSVLDAPMP